MIQVDRNWPFCTLQVQHVKLRPHPCSRCSLECAWMGCQTCSSSMLIHKPVEEIFGSSFSRILNLRLWSRTKLEERNEEWSVGSPLSAAHCSTEVPKHSLHRCAGQRMLPVFPSQKDGKVKRGVVASMTQAHGRWKGMYKPQTRVTGCPVRRNNRSIVSFCSHHPDPLLFPL